MNKARAEFEKYGVDYAFHDYSDMLAVTDKGRRPKTPPALLLVSAQCTVASDIAIQAITMSEKPSSSNREAEGRGRLVGLLEQKRKHTMPAIIGSTTRVGLWALVTGCLGRVAGRSSPPEPTKPETERPREWDLLRAAERDSIVASHVSERLQPLGFVQVKRRLWVDGSDAPVRRAFEMVLLKGGAIDARWGFSLDFVPHLSESRLYWHRSNRTAMFDLFLDLQDRQAAAASFCNGAAWLHHDLERLVPLALGRAQETWRRGSTLPGILDIVREICEQRINSFYVHFRSHLPLTFMFLSAKVSDLAAAQAELEAYACDQEIDEDVVAKLSKLLQDAASVEGKDRRS